MDDVKEGQIVTQPGEPHAIMEMQTLERASEQFKRLQQFVASQMHVDRDFGTIPGCKKASLWKPGAEKLLNLHGLACRLISAKDTIVDWKGEFANYSYLAEVYNPRTGLVLAASEGSCNSKEKKYVTQDFHSIVNTIQKMAQKRAMVGATLLACRASDIFTDLEDDGEEGGGEKKTAAPAGDKISDPQRKRFYAIAKGAGKTDDQIKAKLKTEIGSEHSADIPKTKYEDLCAWAGAKE